MKKNETKFVFIISIISLVIIGLTLIAYNLSELINYKYFTNSDDYIFHTDKLGHFGDFIGGVLGTILTGIATYFVYKTYISQKEELEKQKEELILNRQLIAQQQFESTFFNMLNVHRDLKNDLELNINKRICRVNTYKETSESREVKTEYEIYFTNQIEESDYKGTNVFKLIKLDFENLYQCFRELNNETNSFDSDLLNIKIFGNLSSKKNVLKSSEKNIIDTIYWELFENYKDTISHYCRNVYHILKFIRETEQQNNISYRKYADIFQSQLNVDEQFLLFYNFIVFDKNDNEECLHPINIVNHYHFLENLGSDNLLNKELHNNKNFYNFDIK